MLSVVSLASHREPLAVVAHRHIENTDAEGEGIDDLRLLQLGVVFDDSLRSSVGEQAVQAVVGIVVDNIVNPLEEFLFHHLLFLEVVYHQTSHLGIVEGVDKPAPLAVQGHIGRIIKLDAVQVRNLFLPTGFQVQFHNVGKAAGGVHRGVSLAGSLVVHQRGHRAQGVRG